MAYPTGFKVCPTASLTLIKAENTLTDKAQTQIVNRLETVFGESGLPNDWTTDIATPVFEQDNKYSNSVRLDYVFVRLSGSLVETDVKAQLDAVYCIGVCRAQDGISQRPDSLLGLLSYYLRRDHCQERPMEDLIQRGNSFVERGSPPFLSFICFGDL